jgi:hypothetical protein
MSLGNCHFQNRFRSQIVGRKIDIYSGSFAQPVVWAVCVIQVRAHPGTGVDIFSNEQVWILSAFGYYSGYLIIR